VNELIACEGLEFSYPNGKGIQGIDLSLRTGSLIALIGRNGAGKSTLIANLMGLLVPDSGRLRAFGEDIRPGKDIQYKERIGLCSAEGGLIDNLSLKENFELVSYLRCGRRNAWRDEDEWISKLGIDSMLASAYGELSSGQRRRALIVQTLFGKPPVLLFDEPGNDLDIEGIFILQDLLSSVKPDRAILVSTHIIDVVRSCADQVVFMEKGRIVRVAENCGFDEIEAMYKEIIWGGIKPSTEA
jgi:ABC-type multidrug transport system ATPase subunit